MKELKTPQEQTTQERFDLAADLAVKYFEPACNRAAADFADNEQQLFALSAIEGLLVSAYLVNRLQNQRPDPKDRKAEFLDIARWVADCVEDATSIRHAN